MSSSNGKHGFPSPEFNWDNGVWDNGEAFGTFNSKRADTGGFFGPDNGTTLLPSDIRTQVGWTLTASTWRFIGALSPVALPTNPTKVPDAAFEVFAKDSYDASKPTVIIISLYPTLSSTSRIGYPGKDQLYGLLYDSKNMIARPAPDSEDLVTYSRGPEVNQINIVTAYIVPHIGTRSLVHTIQRNLQLVEAVQHMLQSSMYPPSFGGPLTEDSAVLATGGSFGGLASQTLALFYPSIIHGASSRSFSGSLRRTMGDQDFYTYTASLVGFGPPGQAYNRADCLQWISFYRQYDPSVDYFAASFMTLWENQQVRRPIHFLFSDEDNVTNGNEWASLFTGTYTNAGTAVNPDTTRPHAPVFWSRLDKACHDSMTYVVPGSLHHTSSPTQEHDLRKSVLWMVPKALQSFQDEPNPPNPNFSNLTGTHDPYDHALARRETSHRVLNRTHIPSPSLLSLDTNWSADHKGCGTWLGHDDSMVAEGNAVYVGSAGGVVSKLVAQIIPPALTHQFVIQEQTESLGYRASAMAVSGNDLVVATYRHLHRISLSAGLQAGPAQSVPLDWEESRPGRLKIVDLYGNGTEYIVFRSFHGELVVKELSTLNDHFSYGEPGIQDIEFGTAPRTDAPAGTSIPIYLLSERGRVIKIEITAGQPYVSGVTPAYEGQPQDLVLFPSQGQPALAALYQLTDLVPSTSKNTIKLFSLSNDLGANNLLPVFSFSDFTNQARVGAGQGMPINDLEFFPGSGGLADGFLILHGGLLRYQSTCSTCIRTISLTDPAVPEGFYPTAVELGDIIPGGEKEIIISSESGQMICFPISDLAGQKLTQAVVASDWRVATWGMTFGPAGKIQCLDQVARRWEVDPAGVNPAVEKDLMLKLTEQTPGPVMLKPFMDLAYVGYTPADISSTLAIVDAWGTGGKRLRSPFTTPRSTLIGSATFPFFIPPLPWQVPPPDTRHWNSNSFQQLYAQDYIPLGHGGDSLRIPSGSGGIEYSYWWSRSYRNLVWGTLADTSQASPAVDNTTIWGTAYHDRFTNGTNGFADHLRSVSGNVSHDLQSLRLGHWATESEPRVVVSTTGGSILVLDPTVKPGAQGPSTIAAELDHRSPNQNSGDHGTGGLALCVHDVRGNGNPTIFFGTMSADPRNTGDDMVSSLMIYERTPALQLTQEIRFDGVVYPKIFGLCGLAVGSLDASNPSTKHLVLTTLAGDLLVYELGASTGGGTFAQVSLGPLRQWDIVDGSLGACNGILIDDNSHSLFVSGSLGLRKWQ